MADDKLEGEELKKLVKMGKKRTLSFAFCPGPKNDHLMMIDRRKKPAVIGKVAKKEGSGSKVAYGTFEVKSKTMELTCERTVPAMAKVLKKYLKSQKVLVNIVIMDESGNVLDSDVEDLPEDPSFDQDAGTDTDADTDTDKAADSTEDAKKDAAELVGRIKAAQPALATAPDAAAAKLKKVMAMAVGQIKSGDLESADKTITALEGALAKLGGTGADSGSDKDKEATKKEEGTASADPRALAARAKSLKDAIADIAGPAADKLTKALGGAIGQIKSGDLTGADTMLARIEAAINKATTGKKPETDAKSPDATKWEKALARLQPEVDKLIQEKRGDLAAINRFFNYAKEQADSDIFDKALAAAARVADLIKQAAADTTTQAARDAQDSIPANVVGYTKSRLGWIDTRSGLRKELETLKAAMIKATAGIEGLEDLATKSDELFKYLEDIDSGLEDTLEKLVETPDGDKREDLKSSARKIIADYRGVLDTPFFKDVDDNGFAPTNIRANALESLGKVSTALEA